MTVRVQKPNKAHLALYRRLYWKKEKFNRKDALAIYANYVYRSDRKNSYDGGQCRSMSIPLAMRWFERAVVVLMKHGYLGLTFEKELLPGPELSD